MEEREFITVVEKPEIEPVLPETKDFKKASLITKEMQEKGLQYADDIIVLGKSLRGIARDRNVPYTTVNKTVHRIQLFDPILYAKVMEAMMRNKKQKASAPRKSNTVVAMRVEESAEPVIPGAEGHRLASEN